MRRRFEICDYDLAATLDSGQAFRWVRQGESWAGVVGHRHVRLWSEPRGITAEVCAPVSDWHWLTDYLQLEVDLAKVISTFPDDAPMRAAIAACRGLRLLRQDPWECLASFILSSTKQIIQISQVVENVCRCFGDPVAVPEGTAPAHAFPSAGTLAEVSESELRRCKMGFRAPYLRTAAQLVSTGELELESLRGMPLDKARVLLMSLPGVGPKIADCVLLFAYGFPTAFPRDVWVLRALRSFYFPGRKTPAIRLCHFAETHFGPFAGYAQQYLFHYMRVHRRANPAASTPRTSAPAASNSL
jgi:N-glycosylase/DNA lyase